MITIDETSLLAEVSGATTLAEIEAELERRGLTLALSGVSDGDRGGDVGRMSVADWLARGAPGARSAFADPVDHLVAGLEATLANGKRLTIRPAPRRAVGPDLVALPFGTGPRFACIESAWLRIHRKTAPRPSEPLPEGVDLDPPLTDAESRLVDAIARELSR